MNLPKFVFEDVPLFLGLIGDLFPGLDCPRVRYSKFNDAVEAVLVDNKYILMPHQVSSYPVSSPLIIGPDSLGWRPLLKQLWLHTVGLVRSTLINAAASLLSYESAVASFPDLGASLTTRLSLEGKRLY